MNKLTYMLRPTACVLLFLCYFVSLNGQCPPPGTVFTSQAKIDAMASEYPNCSVLEGNLVIQEASPGSIVNLDGLQYLQEITGNLVIRRLRDLEQLNGLDQLTRIGGELNIQGNPKLKNMNGLGQLNYVGSQSIVANNASLTSMNGLNRLATINGAFYVRSNPTLNQLSGLNGLQSIYGDLVINGNPTLNSLEGLENLLSIGRSTRAELKITNNPSLRELDGLAQLDFGKLSYLEITNCPSLSSGRSNSANALCQYLNAAGRARIYGNGAGFDSVEVLRSACQ